MCLFGIKKQLQFGLCNHGKPCTSSKQQGEEKLFHRGEEEVGRVTDQTRFGLREAILQLFITFASLPHRERLSLHVV